MQDEHIANEGVLQGADYQSSLKLTPAFSTFKDGKPEPKPYVIKGLLNQRGFSSLAAKPKQGKSTLSRYMAVQIAKGETCLDRQVTRGEVILISLEDDISDTDASLRALGYDPERDAAIHIVQKQDLPGKIDEALDALKNTLAVMPNVKLLVIDTLMKFLHITDVNDFGPVSNKVERISDIAREFPHLHVQGILHCRKVATGDIFDSILGSTALRAECDTNIALFSEEGNSGQRIIVSEMRRGADIEPTILGVHLEKSDAESMVKSFFLTEPLAEWKAAKAEKKEQKKKVSLEEQIIDFLQTCENLTAPLKAVYEGVKGKAADKVRAVESLVSDDVLTKTGVERSPTNPQRLTLNREALPVYYLGNSNFQKAAEAGETSDETLAALGCTQEQIH